MKDFNDKLPKTQKQWLHFALKVQTEINKIYRKYVKDKTIKDWFKQVKNVEPKYYSVNLMGRRVTETELPCKPKGNRSYAAIYKKDGLVIERCYIGADELDIRDRGNHYTISLNGMTFSYSNHFATSPYKYVFFRGLNCIVKVNGIEVNARIDGDFDNRKEFHFESEEQHYNGTIDGRKIEVYISLKKNPMNYRPLYVIKCTRRKPRYSATEKAGIELMREFGIGPIGSDLRKQGYRYKEEIEADPE